MHRLKQLMACAETHCADESVFFRKVVAMARDGPDKLQVSKTSYLSRSYTSGQLTILYVFVLLFYLLWLTCASSRVWHILSIKFQPGTTLFAAMLRAKV